jgi:hypothetical protein
MTSSFSVSNILGKGPNEPKLEDIYKLDKQLGRLQRLVYRGDFAWRATQDASLQPVPARPTLLPRVCIHLMQARVLSAL